MTQGAAIIEIPTQSPTFFVLLPLFFMIVALIIEPIISPIAMHVRANAMISTIDHTTMLSNTINIELLPPIHPAL